MTAIEQVGDDLGPEPRLERERAGARLAWEERGREVVRVELRRVDRGLEIEPEMDVVEEDVERPLVLLVAARCPERRTLAGSARASEISPITSVDVVNNYTVRCGGRARS